MNNIAKKYLDIRYVDSLAEGDSPLHGLNAGAKLITTLAFIVAVVSFGKYTVAGFFPFFLYPVVMVTLGDLPAGYLLKKVLLVSPFAVLVGIFNPIMDPEILVHLGAWGVSGGWISFLSILLRFFLTVLAALILVSLTGFPSVCRALRRFGVPRPLVVQLLFFYRYIFILVREGERMERARSMRSFGKKGMGFRTFVSLIGHLLLRSLDRAERIYLAMRCRGFDGEIRMARTVKAGWKDAGFVAGWLLFFILFRFFDVPQWIGTLGMEIVK
jgi:cobalt/nickel transport system permease protein